MADPLSIDVEGRLALGPALAEACRRGDLAALERARAAHGAGAVGAAVAADDHRALRLAYAHNQPAVGAWYVAACGPAALAASPASRRRILCAIAARGSQATAAAAKRDLGLTADDARSGHCAALRAACERGNLAVAKWLMRKFGLAADDARVAHCEALRLACAEGHLEVAQWMQRRNRFRGADLCWNGGEAVTAALIDGHLDVVRWAAGEFGLAQAELARCARAAAWPAFCNGHADAVDWIAALLQAEAAHAKFDAVGYGTDWPSETGTESD